jgi:hypothetical protein
MLESKGFKPKLNVMDNQATKHIKQFLTKKECKVQLVEPHNHWVNAAEQAIQTFKDEFIAALATRDMDFLLQLWDKLHRRCKTLSTLCMPQGLTQQFWHTRPSIARMTGEYIPLHPQGGEQSCTRPWPSGAHGHLAAPMLGASAPPPITTNVICIMCQQRTYIASQAQQNSSLSIARFST